MVGGKLVSTEREVPKADDHFTDREQPRESFAIFFDRLYRSKIKGETGEEKPLLNFYGVGGVGKSTLLKRAQKEFRSRYQHQTDFSQFAIANLDLTALELGNEIPSHELLWKLRNALPHSNVRTPLFDCIYLHIRQADHPGQQLELPKTASQNMADAGLSGLAAITGCQGALAAAKVLWQKAKDRKTFRHIQPLLGGRLPEDCKRDELVEKLPLFLADDIISAFESNPLLRVALCIDEYEQIQEPHRRERSAESQLLTFLGEIITDPTTRDRLGVVIMGRERLTWDRVYQDPDWQNYIESHILSGLSEQDARSFLIERIVPWLIAHNETAAANTLIRYQDPILDLTRSGPEGSAEGCLPLHLDLIVLVARNAGEKFTPELLANPNEQRERIEERFLRYLKRSDSKRLDALQILAYTPAFDRSLFDYLIENRVILGYRPSDFAMVLGGEGDLTDSFVRQHPTWPGYYVLHRQMQTSLVNSTLKSSFGTSGIKERVELLINFYIENARFDDIYKSTELHSHMVEIGFEIFKNNPIQCLLDPEEIKSSIENLVSSFSYKFFQVHNLLIPIQEWLVAYLKDKLHTKHPDTLSAIKNLAKLKGHIGDHISANEYQTTLLKLYQELFGETHHKTLDVMEDLADTLRKLGNHAEAERLYKIVISTHKQIAGNEHPETIKVMQRISRKIEFIDGEFSKTLIKETFDAYSRSLGQKHPETLLAMSDYAASLGACECEEIACDHPHEEQDRVLHQLLNICKEHLETGYPNLPQIIRHVHGSFRSTPFETELLELLVESSKKSLGPEHPDTLEAMNLQANQLIRDGKIVDAQIMKEMIFDISVQTHGIEHQATLNAVKGLAGLFMSKSASAEELSRIKTLFINSLYRLEQPHHHNHRKNLDFRQIYAYFLTRIGALSDAKIIYHDILKTHQKTRYPVDRALEIGISNLSILLCKSDIVGAKLLQEELVAACEQSHGSNHWATINAKEKLAEILEKLRDFEDTNSLRSHL